MDKFKTNLLKIQELRQSNRYNKFEEKDKQLLLDLEDMLKRESKKDELSLKDILPIISKFIHFLDNNFTELF